MTRDFWPGGPEELQRNPRWGIPDNSFVRAYISAASDHFGYVTGAAGLPEELAQFGGGLHNRLSKNIFKPDVDTSGNWGLSKVNEANIGQGYAAGVAARRMPAPFNSYGYLGQVDDSPSVIGDGGGISPVKETLAGVNPDEQPPPAWPPGQSAPVRYLSTRLRY
ncbi:hypothetical protein ACQR1W_38205 [Bradyrhizobium sp. HKCCYLS1011]|uniref:hypothetical protein n=1 Tax=Bradyrhizobium sp. HKCCYLS1011 TaxID=3420733 RepID=UPI003EBDC83F